MALGNLRTDVAEQREGLRNIATAVDRAAVQAVAQSAAFQRETLAPQVNIHHAPITVHPAEVRVIVPEAAVTVTNHVAVPSVEVRNTLPVAAPPIVHVNNTVQAASVEVTARLPERITTTTATRDERGVITGSVSTERNL